jgi:hypothetical protein
MQLVAHHVGRTAILDENWDGVLYPRGYELHARLNPHNHQWYLQALKNASTRTGTGQQSGIHQTALALGSGTALLLAQSLAQAPHSLGETQCSLRSLSQIGLCSHLFLSI